MYILQETVFSLRDTDRSASQECLLSSWIGAELETIWWYLKYYTLTPSTKPVNVTHDYDCFACLRHLHRCAKKPKYSFSPTTVNNIMIIKTQQNYDICRRHTGIIPSPVSPLLKVAFSPSLVTSYIASTANTACAPLGRKVFRHCQSTGKQWQEWCTPLRWSQPP